MDPLFLLLFWMGVGAVGFALVLYEVDHIFGGPRRQPKQIRTIADEVSAAQRRIALREAWAELDAIDIAYGLKQHAAITAPVESLPPPADPPKAGQPVMDLLEGAKYAAAPPAAWEQMKRLGSKPSLQTLVDAVEHQNLLVDLHKQRIDQARMELDEVVERDGSGRIVAVHRIPKARIHEPDDLPTDYWP